MAKGGLMLWCHMLVWAAAAALALWAGGASAAVRYDTATPYAPPYNKYKYIPLHKEDIEHEDLGDAEEAAPARPGMAPSELFLTGLRTILDVVRNINKRRASARVVAHNATLPVIRKSSSANGTQAAESGRGLEEYGYGHYDPYGTTTPKPVKQGRYTDPWAGYYDWIINEGSFKFWSAFQLFTAALLLYACFSAIYYAKFNPILPDYSMEYDDYFLERSVGRNARSVDASLLPSGLSWINSSTFQFILDAIAKHYEEE